MAAACRRSSPGAGDRGEAPPEAPSWLATLDLAFDGAEARGGAARALVIAPKDAPKASCPVLVALHGRGEAVRGAEVGAYGWWRDYRLGATLAALQRRSLTTADFGGHVEPARLQALNAGLRERAFGGLVIVCPHTPDLLSVPKSERHLGAADRFATWLADELLPRVRREVACAGPDTGIDGVSLGGRVALLAGLGRPDVFRAVGTLQPAITEGEADALAARAKSWAAGRTDGSLRLLTSDGDYFRPAVAALSAALARAGVAHDHRVIVGPHDYAFNRGPGGLEMLLFHDRVLRGAKGL